MTERRRTGVNRRTVLLGSLGGLGSLATVGVVAATGGLRRPRPTASGRSSPAPSPTTDRRAGTRVSGSFTSAARLGRSCGWTLAYPTVIPEPLRVLVVLHGKGADHTYSFDKGLHLDKVLATTVAAGTKPFAIASVDGGDTYWHRRTSGEDSGRMVTDEFVPMLATRGVDTSKVAFLGWSMGGYGSLHLAAQLGAGRVAAVAAESPAIWLRAGGSAPGAFDDADDFDTHTVFGHQAQLAGIPLRIDCGTGDSFYDATKDYVASLTPHPAGGFQPGAHDLTYWRARAPEQLAFIGAHLPA
jgi:S-formylglutathione hydrolase FrmB